MDSHWHFNMTLVPYPNYPGSLVKEWDHNFVEGVSMYIYIWIQFTSIYVFTQWQTIADFLIPWEFVS